MSWEAMVWAIQQRAPTSSAKFVLVGLGNCAAPEDWHAWPSVAYLSDCTQQDRKTVLSNLGRLEHCGLIHRAGNAGRTNQVTKWRLSVPAGWSPSGQASTRTKNGTGTQNGTVPIFRGNSTKSGTATSTKNGTRNHEGNHKGNNEARKRASVFNAGAIELPKWLPREAWTAWVADRADRRKPLTERAAAAQLVQLAEFRDLGHDPQGVLRQSIRAGYQGLFAPKAAAGPGRAPLARPVLDADHLFTGSAP